MSVKTFDPDALELGVDGLGERVAGWLRDLKRWKLERDLYRDALVEIAERGDEGARLIACLALEVGEAVEAAAGG